MKDIQQFLIDQKLHLMRIDDKQGKKEIVNIDHNIFAYCLAGYINRFEKAEKPAWKKPPKYGVRSPNEQG